MAVFRSLILFRFHLVAGMVLFFTVASSPAASVSLAASDAGGASSLNAAGHWSNGAAPTTGNSYYTQNYVLRSPADANAYTFGGAGLSIDPYPGGGNVGGRLLLKGPGGATITVTNLILNGGLVDYANAAGDDGLETLAGNLTLNSGTTNFLGALSSETLLITAPISGSGNLQIGGATINGGTDVGTVIFAGIDSSSGDTTVAGGTLLVNALLNNANVIVNGGTLGGTGVIVPRASGQISISSNGGLAPGGTTLGTLTVDGSSASSAVLTFASGAGLSFQLNSGGQGDALRLTNGVANDILFSNNTINFTDLSNGSLSNGLYTLFGADTAGAYSGLTVDGSNYITAGLVIGSGLFSYSARLRVVNDDLDLEIAAPASAPAATFPLATTNSLGASLVVGSNGIYSVTFVSPALTFAGDLGQSLTGRTLRTGVDNLGAYSEIDFNYTNAAGHAAGIRLYTNSPVVLFTDTTLAAGANDMAFPHWSYYPKTQGHLAYGADGFGEYSFTNFYDDSPWLFFNTNFDTFILSAATNYMVASTVMNSDGSIVCGINSAIAQLPAGFTHRVILTAQNGINQSYTTWGDALLALAGKTPPANDAAVELNKLGYWTDNGAAYYYNTNAPLGIQNTLLAIKNEYASKGVPLSYLQLDSWWYEKAGCQCWSSTSGIYLYQADPTLFPTDLIGFQQQLGLPLITHSRWIDPSSPYVGQYLMSANVITDPRYWTNRMVYLKSSGVITFEQDWLSANGTPAMSLTNGGAAYLDNMQAAAATNGINLQYCMLQGRNYLQGSLYTNLMTIRVSYDVFGSARWREFIYDSRLAQAIGAWPWCDEFRSAETRNALVATLSAGPVGCGDALGTVSATNLLQSVRPDGVIVKPDVPLTPTDATYVNDAMGLNQPFIATTGTDDTNSRAIYVFAFGENSANLAGTFTPALFGLTNNAYVYDYFNATGTVVTAGGAYHFTTVMPDSTSGGSYFVMVPMGPSGMAFLGDPNKFVTRGKKRISAFSDTGVMRATVAFAAGETNVTLCGYAPASPYLFALAGSSSNLTYSSVTHQFALNMSPDNSGTATVALSLTPVPSLGIAPQPPGKYQISWPVAAVGYGLEKTTNLAPPAVWVQTTDSVNTLNGQNVVTITNASPSAFYRLKQ
jgi:hypothetical protein